ncbi:mitochondrial intermembrane space protein Mia40 [Cordyceps fumosorosea ARSEF 2679]|uniref:Mitochondrial intermembrane space import and assembly protein 40 n=1 Tax=Cordyceps fumosorosea (strain ARSEF 2679) TaxID=1081104 RepID=A0A168AS63_CORFA|nr:mitochondrial intermembrane space protein Mia40 [Cordyceps fumosorosea ARSEF 2679]OAA69125.1 mitochondrial intermembrane space protein Mia40 [Cordyceps fumosorosea ARSEF 2679]
MFRTALQSGSRPATSALRTQALRSAPRRFASTSPADKSRSWKGSAVRWTLAGGAVYYYSTSSVFAEEAIPAKQFSTAPPSFPEAAESVQLPTVESIVEERKSQATAKATAQTPAKSAAEPTPSTQGAQKDQTAADSTAVAGSPLMGPEEENDQQAAFNPETGEINWDCPCLGGMAHGPCGEEFKTAFSCFVYSNEEPKGMECIDKFQGMQECFRKYPEIYGAELAEADDAEDLPAGDLELPAGSQPPRGDQAATESQAPPPSDDKAAETPSRSDASEEQPARVADVAVFPTQEKTEKKSTESEPAAAAAIPEASIDSTTSATTSQSGPKWEDATDANKEATKPKGA